MIGQKSIGFNADIIEKHKNNVSELLRQVLPQDFVKFGLIPEFIGRVPVNVSLDLLDEEALVRILTEPKSAIVKQYQKLFELDGVNLEFDQDALQAIAHKAIERETGARGLRAIMESVVMDLMYEVPSEDDVTLCRITKDVVEKKAEPEVLRSDIPHKKAPVKKHPKKSNGGEIA